jgi:hypothetical protein
MWRRFRTFFCVFSLILLSLRAESQNLVYSFVDPCTKAVTNFSVPVQGGTTVFFLNQSRFFTASDVSNGTFGSWVNQVYTDYRKVSPCSVQSAAVTRNQITASVVSSVVSSVMSSIGTSMSLGGVTTNSGSSGGGDDNASKGKTQSEKKKNTNNNGNNNNTNSTSSSNSGSNGGNTTTAGNNTSGQTNNSGNNTGTQSNGNNGGSGSGGNTGSSTAGQTGGQGNGSQSGGSNQQGTAQTSGVGSEQKSEKGSEVVATTTVNVDVRNDRGSDNSSGGGGGSKKSSAAKQQKSNPLIVSSDLTSAQNLDKSFTGIINVGMSQSSLTGTSSWGVTSMVWFNLKQFALNGRYTIIKLNDKGTLKFIHNVNLTGAYSYGNVFGFLGYSIIMNAGKYGITGANVSGAVTKSPDDKNLFISPSITAFYTKPFQAGKKLTISPELYVISTPVVYSSVDKITVTDRYFSGFLGSGFDYQLSRRFKVNINYKANLSTNPEFPILSFFLIGSKINL